MRMVITWMISSALTLSAVARAEDCALGQRDLALAQDRIANVETVEAAELLRLSIEACPTYDAYEQLGELLAKSAHRRDRVNAVDAFVAAHARAHSSKTRAQTLYQYALLLNREDDPQNAYPLITQARTLDPARPDIAELAATIETQVQSPKKEQITRALRYTLFKPLTGGSIAATKTAFTAASGPSVNIPINFDTGSTEVDEQTRPNVSELAAALADASLEGKRFLFIGHSDARGNPQYNAALSLQRAEAISHRVVELEPSLKGRIRVEGHGAREPIDLGTDQRALRANRRLQVIPQ